MKERDNYIPVILKKKKLNKERDGQSFERKKKTFNQNKKGMMTEITKVSKSSFMFTCVSFLE